MLGYAATTDVKDIPLLVVDADRSSASRELMHRFEPSANFKIVDVPRLDRRDRRLSRSRRGVDGAERFRPDYGRRRRDAAGRTTMQVVADGTDSNSTTVALGYAQRSSPATRRNLPPAAAPGMPVTAPGQPDIRVWFNPRLESRDFMIPGIVALLLLVVTTNLSAMAIVREKEVGTLEQLNVTPLARWELIVGKLLPYALIGIIDVVLVLVVAVYWFEVPMRGSIPLLFAMQPDLPAVHAGPGPVRVHHLADAAAGDDDDDVLLPDADDLPVGLHLPDREHARRGSSR